MAKSIYYEAGAVKVKPVGMVKRPFGGKNEIRYAYRLKDTKTGKPVSGIYSIEGYNEPFYQFSPVSKKDFIPDDRNQRGN